MIPHTLDNDMVFLQYELSNDFSSELIVKMTWYILNTGGLSFQYEFPYAFSVYAIERMTFSDFSYDFSGYLVGWMIWNILNTCTVFL